ncbi:MAG: hypothetical protein IKZ09_03115 [Clostridia bacterium]|nr:hypothetical protein [Clostridia bacterium]
MMKQCIIADFEWCVTPHPTGDRFQYFNEILSAGAVRIDETGTVIDRFYALIRPESAEYLHPVVLTSLRLDRSALSEAQSFSEVFRRFLAFVGNTRVFTWGCADRSALVQNLRMKAGYSAEQAGAAAPQMRDLQPLLSRGAGISPPYPSLAAVLSALSIKNENRHNAMADAEDTARIVCALYQKDPALIAQLFAGCPQSAAPSATGVPSPKAEEEAPLPTFRTPGEALNDARRHPRSCPVCRTPIGVGTWIRASKTEILTLCSCEEDGRFLCSVTAAQNPEGRFCAHAVLSAFEGAPKAAYEAARRAARMRRLQQAKASDSTVQAVQTVPIPHTEPAESDTTDTSHT